jgi:hypothetical protein
MVSATQFGRGRIARWIAPVSILLVVLMIGTALHVHAKDLTAATCLVCVNARTSAPAAVVAAQVRLVTLAAAFVVRACRVPTSEASLLFFIRPPPVA